MKTPDTPQNEAERLASLRALNILDTPLEERFDRITRLARRILGVPIALLSLVDADRQWFKSIQGLEATETPRAISFCGHAILGSETFVVPDAKSDERFHDNPLVTNDPNIRFYAGRPVTSPDGHRVGTFCLLDTAPRQLSEDDLKTLDDLAKMVEQELSNDRLFASEQHLRAALSEAERRASIDALTRLWNRGAIDSLLEAELERAHRTGDGFCVLLIDVDHFKRVNDTHGHAVGDLVLKGVAAELRAGVRAYDSVGRYGGDEFIVILPNCSGTQAFAVADRIRESVARLSPTWTDVDSAVTLSIGIAITYPRARHSGSALLEGADRALYIAKREGRNRIGVETMGTA